MAKSPFSHQENKTARDYEREDTPTNLTNNSSLAATIILLGM